jgi:hypothetical protein
MPRISWRWFREQLRFLTTAAAYLLIVFFSAFASSSSGADEPEASSRAESTAVIANARKILTPYGVERLERVQIGGVDRYRYSLACREDKPSAACVR